MPVFLRNFIIKPLVADIKMGYFYIFNTQINKIT